jgi:hypothetical protein
MPDNPKLCLIIGVIVLLAVIVYFCTKNKKANFSIGSQKNMEVKAPEVPSEMKLVEGFTGLAAGANDNTGILLDDSYDLIQGADDGVPAHHFADLVNQGDHLKDYIRQPKDIGENLRPMERLSKVQGKSLMPRTSTSVTPYNVDVANPTSHKFRAAAPRVSSSLKSKYKDYHMSSFIRGDIPITYYPSVPLVAKTHQGRDDLRLDGLFTPYFNALFAKYSGRSYKNLVQKTAGAGQAEGYGGSSGGLLLDAY